MVKDLYLHRQGGKPNNTHLLGLDHLMEIKQNSNLVDIWRKQNPNKKQFTFHNYNNSIKSRIGRSYIEKTSIFPNSLSDYQGITLAIKISKTTFKGKRYWKLNANIIKQKKFINFSKMEKINTNQ